MDPLVLEQRIRNRLIEYVEWVVEYQAESEPRLGMGDHAGSAITSSE